MPLLKLTKKNIDSISLGNARYLLYWDTELKGFGLKAGKDSKTFIVQRDINGKTIRNKIGRYGVWTVDEAKREARERLLFLDKGIDIAAKKKEKEIEVKQITFDEAWEMHKEAMKRKNASARTIFGYEKLIKDYLQKIKNRSLASLTRAEIRQLHSYIGTNHGHYVANHAMRLFRAVYNTAMKEDELLPPNPSIAVQWYKEYRKQEPIEADKLQEWYTKVMKMPNILRRDFQFFLIFTGLRRTDTCTINWKDVNIEAGTLHRPNPKGGKERAFTIPLPDICIEILKRRRVENEILFGKDCEWLFPTRDINGNITHLREPKENKRGLPSPHRLRDTYTTAANSAGLSPYDIEVLTNHRPAKSTVTAGYIKQDIQHLAVQQQKVADYLKQKMGIIQFTTV